VHLDPPAIVSAVADALLAVGALPPDSPDSLSRGSASVATLEGNGTFWLWPPVDPQARQLRVTVSTLWEAAWALLGIPGR
jgi:hypothetical protein